VWDYLWILKKKIKADCKGSKTSMDSLVERLLKQETKKV
jgi:hypothetical protein